MRLVDPLGLSGVTIDALELGGRYYEDGAGATHADLSVVGQASFPGLPDRPSVGAALVVLDGAVALAAVTLTLATPLTLTEILDGLLGGAGAWAAAVTDQFAFESGELYWAERALTHPVGGRPYLPGYNIAGVFLLFGRWRLAASLSRPAPGAMILAATVARLDFDFIVLEAVTLGIEKAADRKTITLSIGTITILDKPLAAATAAYLPDSGGGAFTGSIAADLGTIDLPLGIGAVDVTLAIGFSWSKADGLRITRIGGLPTALPELPAELYEALNGERGDCSEVLASWLTEVSVELKPSLGKSPKKSGGAMQLEVDLDYLLKFEGREIKLNDGPVAVPISIPIPHSLGDLPGALLSAVGDAMGEIVKTLMSRPATYEALAIVIGIKFGAKAFARLICQAIQKFLEVAEKIAEEAAKAVAETLTEIAELASALVQLSAALIGGLVGVLSSLWDAIRKLWDDIVKVFDPAKKKEAEEKEQEARDRVQRQWDQVRAQLRPLEDRIGAAQASMRIDRLETYLDDGDAVCARITPHPGAPSYRLDSGQRLTAELDFLSGEAGDAAGAPMIATTPAPDSVLECVPLARFGAGDYRMNASIQKAMSAVPLIDPHSQQALRDAANSLIDVGDTAADFGDYLHERLDYFDRLGREGITGNKVYATSAVPSYMTVGVSRLGINSRVAA